MIMAGILQRAGAEESGIISREWCVQILYYYFGNSYAVCALRRSGQVSATDCGVVIFVVAR